MALASTGVFTVDGSAGSNSHSGYYNPAASGAGTDLTFPSSPVSLTDLVIHSSTTTKVKSASLVAVSAIPNGNSIQIASGTGFTTGTFEVTGNDGTYWILDRAAGTAGSTGGAGIAGGSLATPAAALSLMVGSNLMNIKDNGSYYDIGAGLTTPFVSGANYSAPTRIRGFAVTPGDVGMAILKQTSSLGTNNALTLNGNGWTISNLIINAQGTSSGSSNIIFSGNSNHRVENCKLLNPPGSGSAAYFIGTIYNCEITGTYGTAVGAYGSTFVNMIASTIHDIPHGIQTGSGAFVERCKIYNITSGPAISGDVPTVKECAISNIAGNAIYSSNQGSGTQGWCIQNNVISQVSGYGIATGVMYDPASALMDGNAFYSCSSGNRDSSHTFTKDIALTAAPFVSGSTGDLRLNNNAGGGAAIRGNAYPQSWMDAPTIPNARDMGAYQHATPALGLTVDASGAHPVLTWDADPLATNYYVKVYNDSGGSTPPTTGTTYTVITVIAAGTTTYTHTAAASGTNYYEVSSSH